MARRLPARYKSGKKKGQFMSKRARAARKSTPRKRARSNPGRTVQRRQSAPRKRARRAVARGRPAPKRRYSRNPRRPNIVRVLMDGTIEAAQILAGKAAVRTLPDLVGLPKQGYMGIATQVGTALVIGFTADMFLSRGAARALTAGALTAPLETLIVANRVPWLSGALSPVSGQAALGAYVSPRAFPANGGVGAYVRAPRGAPRTTARGLNSYH